jgi:hypothetical protein
MDALTFNTLDKWKCTTTAGSTVTRFRCWVGFGNRDVSQSNRKIGKRELNFLTITYLQYVELHFNYHYSARSVLLCSVAVTDYWIIY